MTHVGIELQPRCYQPHTLTNGANWPPPGISLKKKNAGCFPPLPTPPTPSQTLAEKSKIKVPVDSVSGETALPGLQMAVFSLCSHRPLSLLLLLIRIPVLSD